MILALAAVAFSLWSLASTGNRWEDVSALTFSPDGKTLAAAHRTTSTSMRISIGTLAPLVQTLALFDAETGSGRVTIDESTGTSGATPSGAMVFVISQDGDLRIFVRGGDGVRFFDNAVLWNY